MARPDVRVTFRQPDPARIPDVLVEGAAWFSWLLAQGKLDELGQKLRIRRQGGYCGLDIFLHLLLFVTAGPPLGFKRLWKLIQPRVGALAALAGRSSLPSPSSMTRALAAIDTQRIRPLARWMLVELTDLNELLRQRVVTTTDATASSWHIFDIDPTVVTLRQRALPRGCDLPEPLRRAEQTGNPGYAGRKRGQLQYQQVTVQHQGSGGWIHAHLTRGNGEGVVDLEAAVDSICATVDALGHACEATLARMDGAGGSVPFFATCLERGVAFVSRLNRKAMYTDAGILHLLRTERRWVVPDSGSGPVRAAIDLGWHELCADARTTRPDGSPYKPVRVRIVASLYPRDPHTGRKHPGGMWLDGWQVELFATTLPDTGWPPEAVVAAYFGRASEENAFAQEDRELGLSRIASYHLPGQELAVLVGLMVWNLRLMAGFRQHRPPQDAVVGGPAARQPDERVPPSWPQDPVLARLLSQLDWVSVLSKRPGWSFDEVRLSLVCPQGRTLTLTTVRKTEQAKGRTGLIFRRRSRGCEACSHRSTCLHTKAAGASKHAEVTVPTKLALRLRQRLAAVRVRRERPSAVPRGPRAVQPSLFLPSAARRAFTDTLLNATVSVTLERARRPPRPRLIAASVAQRQCRRQTWTQTVERYALPPHTRVELEVAATPALQALFGDPSRSTSQSSSAS